MADYVVHDLAWRERADRPVPAGLVAGGDVMRALLRELAARADAARAQLSVVAMRDLLVLLGPADSLPWLDGVQYCAPAPHAPGLWLPTRHEPALPADLVYGALRRRTNASALLLWRAPDLVLGLDGALPLRPEVLAWLGRELA